MNTGRPIPDRILNTTQHYIGFELWVQVPTLTHVHIPSPQWIMIVDLSPRSILKPHDFKHIITPGFTVLNKEILIETELIFQTEISERTYSLVLDEFDGNFAELYMIHEAIN
jgi:hypothetical protein